MSDDADKIAKPAGTAVLILPPRKLAIEARMVSDMTETAATALKAVARSTYEVPAQERTKQEREVTERARWAAYQQWAPLVLAFGFLWFRPDERVTVAGITIALFGVNGIQKSVEAWRKRNPSND